MIPDKKICPSCGEQKEFDEFVNKSPKRKGWAGKKSYCRTCHNERIRDYHRRRNYGISSEEFEDLLDSQGGVCAICGTEQPGGMGNFSIDHDHVTRRIRGLLCKQCNTLLGMAQDSIPVLTSAISYLLEHRGESS